MEKPIVRYTEARAANAEEAALVIRKIADRMTETGAPSAPDWQRGAKVAARAARRLQRKIREKGCRTA